MIKIEIKYKFKFTPFNSEHKIEVGTTIIRII